MAKSSKSTPTMNTAVVQTNQIITTEVTTRLTSYIPVTKSRSATGEKKLTPMDPKLQQAILLHRSGIRKSPTSSTSENELAVIASVTDTESWNNQQEVRNPTLITRARGNEPAIVTGRIPIQRIEHIRSLPFVKSLKAARKVTEAVHKTVPDVGANKYASTPAKQTGGKGVLVGIIDFGCDFAHQNFLDKNGKTRLVKFWDQTASTNGNGVPYGRLHLPNDINKAIKSAKPYETLGHLLHPGAHGTHVMDIAAGNGKGSGFPGVAPAADLIFVQLSTSNIPWEGPDVVGKNFGDSVNLVEAIRFIFDEAGDKPCVINISLGTNGGPHDGSTLVEKAIDGMLQEKPNRAVVIAAANSHEDGIHTAGQVPGNGTYDVSWLVDGNDFTENELEIWYKGSDQLLVEVIDPTGQSLGTVEPDETGQVKDSNGKVQLVISNRLNDPNNHDNVIGIWLKEHNPGNWTVRLINNNSKAVPFHGWIERDDRGPSTFGGARDNSHTLGSISCSHKSITVASYDATKKGSPISWFSSEGPTRDGRHKPEISAPGSNILAANSTTKKERTLMSGTSMAAPAVTGCIALLYAAAAAAGKKLTIDELRTIITKKGRLNPPDAAWDSRFGYGRIFVPDMIGLLSGVKTAAVKAFDATPGELIKKQPKKTPPKTAKKSSRTKRKRAL
ncbi:peptidase S8 [Niastella caeni]|uniref:Peptidase S8 n=1 Tax=Niastella caeni TaxID=2569763 RepID=A0A4S8I002_9BACT|nr:S8 family peptidase [Niastella caeni]THU40449.1 peptidase S8 [Niastella caeni]